MAQPRNNEFPFMKVLDYLGSGIADDLHLSIPRDNYKESVKRDRIYISNLKGDNADLIRQPFKFTDV